MLELPAKSIFCANQVRAAGQFYDQNQQKLGGKQRLVTTDGREIHMFNSDGLAYLPGLDTAKLYNYDGFCTSPSVGTFAPNYFYATTHHLISSSLYIAKIVPDAYTITSLVRYCINVLSGRHRQVDVKKLRRLFLFKIYYVMMKTIEATPQLGGFNQHLPMRQSNNCFPYSRPRRHKDDAIDNFFSSVQDHNGTTTVEIIVGTNTLLTDIYTRGYNSGLNISKFLQCRFRERGIPINIWSDNA